MHFESGHIYHIFNQGNNKQAIFFNRENYLFFLKKIKKYITPHADILAWCLMPNHFHLLVWFKNEDNSEGLTLSEALTTTNTSKLLIKKPKTLNDSIGIILRSYTRAIQKQENISGSLFRKQTKAINLTQITQLTPVYFNTQFGTKINITIPEKEYPQVCFNYIHNNPVAAQLVDSASNWEFSSAQDYANLRNGTLIQKQKAQEVGLVW